MEVTTSPQPGAIMASAETPTAEDTEFLRDLVARRGCRKVKLLPGRRYGATVPCGPATAVVEGRIGTEAGPERCWHYHTARCAETALGAWDGAPGTEPQGWHLDPATGRTGPHEAANDHVHW